MSNQMPINQLDEKINNIINQTTFDSGTVMNIVSQKDAIIKSLLNDVRVLSTENAKKDSLIAELKTKAELKQKEEKKNANIVQSDPKTKENSIKK